MKKVTKVSLKFFYVGIFCYIYYIKIKHIMTTLSSSLETIIHEGLTRKEIIDFLIQHRDFCIGAGLEMNDSTNHDYMDESFNDQDLIEFYEEARPLSGNEILFQFLKGI